MAPRDPPGGAKTPQNGGVPKTPKNGHFWGLRRYTHVQRKSGKMSIFPEFPPNQGVPPPRLIVRFAVDGRISVGCCVRFADISSSPSLALALKRIALALHDDVRLISIRNARALRNADALLRHLHRSSDSMLLRNGGKHFNLRRRRRRSSTLTSMIVDDVVVVVVDAYAISCVL